MQELDNTGRVASLNYPLLKNWVLHLDHDLCRVSEYADVGMPQFHVAMKLLLKNWD